MKSTASRTIIVIPEKPGMTNIDVINIVVRYAEKTYCRSDTTIIIYKITILNSKASCDRGLINKKSSATFCTGIPGKITTLEQESPGSIINKQSSTAEPRNIVLKPAISKILNFFLC